MKLVTGTATGNGSDAEVEKETMDKPLAQEPQTIRLQNVNDSNETENPQNDGINIAAISENLEENPTQIADSNQEQVDIVTPLDHNNIDNVKVLQVKDSDNDSQNSQLELDNVENVEKGNPKISLSESTENLENLQSTQQLETAKSNDEIKSSGNDNNSEQVNKEIQNSDSENEKSDLDVPNNTNSFGTNKVHEGVGKNEGKATGYKRRLRNVEEKKYFDKNVNDGDGEDDDYDHSNSEDDLVLVKKEGRKNRAGKKNILNYPLKEEKGLKKATKEKMKKATKEVKRVENVVKELRNTRKSIKELRVDKTVKKLPPKQQEKYARNMGKDVKNMGEDREVNGVPHKKIKRTKSITKGRKLTPTELTAQSIVDQVTRNLERRAKLAKLNPVKKPVQRSHQNLVHIRNVNTPMQYFMFQYKILESCSLVQNRDKKKKSQPDCYNFMTFAVKRFIGSLAKLVQQVDPRFNLNKWDSSTLVSDEKVHPVPIIESNAAVNYLESVFGRFPSKSPEGTQQEQQLVDVLSKKRKLSSEMGLNASTSFVRDQNTTVSQEGFTEDGGDKKLQSNVNYAIMQLQNDIAKNSNLQGNHLDENSDNEDYEDGEMDYDLEDTEDKSPGGVKIVNEVSDHKERTVVKTSRKGARNIEKLICTYCNMEGFTFVGKYISHMMLEHFAKKVIEFMCDKCNQCAVISSKSSLASCINHARGKCVDVRTENALQPKAQMNRDGLTYTKCGLCGFKAEAIYEKEMLKLDTDIIVDHFLEKHNPEYFCEKCEKHFNTKEIFELHQSYCPFHLNPEINEGNKPEIYYYMQNKCSVHAVTFENEFSYADHSLQFHLLDIAGGEICRVMNLSLANLTTKRDEKLEISFPCNICGRDKVKFKTSNEWSEHAGSMHKSAGFQCDVCCKFLGCIKQHNRNTHSILDEHYFMCNVDGCLYKGAAFENIMCHLKLFHRPEDQKERMNFLKHCAAPGCDYTVEIEYAKGVLTKEYKKRTRELCAHYENVHKRRFCDKCGKFTSKGYYEAHMESHAAEETGVKNYTCSYCQKTFIHRQSLKDHEKRHDEKNKTHICHQCGKKFFTSGDLCTHVKVSHATDEQKQFVCNSCNKAFARRGLLKAHQKQCCPGEYPVTVRENRIYKKALKLETVSRVGNLPRSSITLAAEAAAEAAIVAAASVVPSQIPATSTPIQATTFTMVEDPRSGLTLSLPPPQTLQISSSTNEATSEIKPTITTLLSNNMVAIAGYPTQALYTHTPPPSAVPPHAHTHTPITIQQLPTLPASHQVHELPAGVVIGAGTGVVHTAASLARHPELITVAASTTTTNNPAAATDLRIPMLHPLDNYDPHHHQRNVDENFAQNLMQHFPRLPFTQTLENQPQAHLNAFFSQFQQYQM